MEFQLVSAFFPFISSFLFIIMVLKVCRSHKAKNMIRRLPPGPWKLPIIGNMHQLVGSLPHHILRDLADIHGPLMHLQLGEVSTVVVSTPEAAKEILRTHDCIFAFRPLLLAPDIISYGGAGIAFAPYGDYWRQMLKICGSVLLNSKRVESFQLIREEEVSHLLKFIHANIGSPINLGEQIFSMTYGMTARVAFGNKCKEHKALITAVREGADATGGSAIADVFPSIKVLHVISGMRPKLEKIHKGLNEILDNIVKDHKATKTRGKDGANDLLSVLLKLQELGDLEVPLTNDHIKAVMLDIFTAGSETSSSTVEWAMSEMVKTPRLMEKAQVEVRQVFGATGNVDEKVLKLIRWIAARSAGSPINITEEIYSLTYCITSRAAFGKKSKDHEKAIYIGKEAAKAAGGFALADVFPSVKLLPVISGMRAKLERLHKEADMIMENIIKEHKERRRATNCQVEHEAEEDFVDVLLKYHTGQAFSLTTENIKAVIQDIFGAGSETSSTTVDWVMAEMIKNPRTMKMAQDEIREVFNRIGRADETAIKDMKYLNFVIKETLRLHPSAPLLLPRECRETCKIGGYDIPVKTKLVINAWAIGRDPKYWTEPQLFAPERFLDSSIYKYSHKEIT